LVFPATIGLSRRSINIDGKDIPLSPGMSVSVEIRTGQLRAIDYVPSPLREVAATSAADCGTSHASSINFMFSQ